MRVRTWCALRGALLGKTAPALALAAAMVLGIVRPSPARAAGHPAEAAPAPAALPTVVIGGWSIRAGDCSYDSTNDAFEAHTAREVDPQGGGSQVTTLWSALVAESGSSATLVDLQSFEPANLSIGSDTEVEMTGTYSLGSGESLCLRVFDHEPASNELTSGALLWEC